jgi:DNA-binding IclR family transcriptional regulator
VHSEDDENGRQTLTPFAATQKALLTQLSKERLWKVLNSIRILSDPLIDIEELETEIDRVREKGFCISNGVRVPDAIGISAPVPGYTCPLALLYSVPRQE